MTFYLTDDFRATFGSHCSDFVSYIIKSLIINCLCELLIHGNRSCYGSTKLHASVDESQKVVILTSFIFVVTVLGEKL